MKMQMLSSFCLMEMFFLNCFIWRKNKLLCSWSPNLNNFFRAGYLEFLDLPGWRVLCVSFLACAKDTYSYVYLKEQMWSAMVLPSYNLLRPLPFAFLMTLLSPQYLKCFNIDSMIISDPVAAVEFLPTDFSFPFPPSPPHSWGVLGGKFDLVAFCSVLTYIGRRHLSWPLCMKNITEFSWFDFMALLLF